MASIFWRLPKSSADILQKATVSYHIQMFFVKDGSGSTLSGRSSSTHQCTVRTFSALMGMLMTPGSDIAGLVLLRVYAYYGRSQKLFWVLSSLWIVAFCATFVELTVALKDIIRTSSWEFVSYTRLIYCLVSATSQFEPTLKLCIAVFPNWLVRHLSVDDELCPKSRHL